MNKIFLAIGAVVVAILVASSSLFIVDQRQVAVIKTFGEIKSVITEPRDVARLRMQEAKQWLLRDRMKIAVVARRLGYESEAAFSRAFKRIIGAPPSYFRATPIAADKGGRPGPTDR